MEPNILKKKVLIVEDEEPVRRFEARALERGGYSCVEAASVAEAREHLKGEGFALALTDIHMPEVSGLELARYLGRERPDIATIVVTGVDDPEIAAIALDMGAYGYIVKPFEADELVVTVNRAIVRREMENREREQTLDPDGTITGRSARADTAQSHPFLSSCADGTTLSS